MRKIIHIDMDAFYASVEQRDFPEYRGKALVVGGLPEGRGGVVATASYEARKFGVRSAMPSKKAQQLCPLALFVRPRFEAYKEVSRQIRAVFHRYTDLVEPLSLDEAYLDVTEDKLGIGSALEIAALIKKAIREEIGLTASAGVSINKFVAKIASDLQKPDGLTFIGPSRIEAFIEALPVEKFFGVGKVTAGRMKELGIHTGADLKKWTERDLVQQFGKTGRFYYGIARGIDDRTVEPNRETKSIGAEDTFPEDLETEEALCAELEKIGAVLIERLKRKGLRGRTVTLKIKYSDFRINTRSQSFSGGVVEASIVETAKDLLRSSGWEGQKIRLLGITVSNFGESRPAPRRGHEDQLELFGS